jgi:predicted dehydrogenase
MLNAAIVGMGRWGQILVNSVQGEGEARQGAPIRFVAGTTRSPDKARDWAGAQKLRLLPDFAAVLADREIQAVVLATPHAQHAEQVIAAARAGKHVFCEKPFTLDRASAAAAVAACQKAGVVMALGHNRRFLPAVALMKSMLAEGRLGTLLHVEGQFSGPGARAYQPGMWRADRAESPLGGMGGMGIHMIDMIIHLAGRFRQVSVVSKAQVSKTIDDTTAMLAELESGATVGFATLAMSPSFWRVALFGTEGILQLQGHESLSFTPREGEPWVKNFPKTDIEAAELAAFATAVAGGPAYPLPVAEAIHGVAVFEAMIGAAASGSSYAVEAGSGS